MSISSSTTQNVDMKRKLVSINILMYSISAQHWKSDILLHLILKICVCHSGHLNPFKDSILVYETKYYRCCCLQKNSVLFWLSLWVGIFSLSTFKRYHGHWLYMWSFSQVHITTYFLFISPISCTNIKISNF